MATDGYELRVRRFSETTGVLRGGNAHPDRCVCQTKETGPYADTPHTHYQVPPYACARCKCAAYDPALPSAPSPDPERAGAAAGDAVWKMLDACREAPGTRVEFGYESLRDAVLAHAASAAETAVIEFEEAHASDCERAADKRVAEIVAWLRRLGEDAGPMATAAAKPLADAIERGEYKKGGPK